MNNMSDLSFTQTNKVMKSTHLDRQKGNYIPWWIVVSEHNRGRKTVIDRRAKGWRSNSAVFTGC